MDYEVAGNILWVPLLDIFVDPEFNCRGQFTSQEVYTLGQNIASEGQLAPLIIQPIEDVPPDEQPTPCAWKFRLIAGHRRYMAIDKWTPNDKAKCIVETGLSRQQARALNFTENLQRKDLNMLEEALALRETWPTDEIKDIAKIIGKPKKWIQSRFDLLHLPSYVQEKARLGTLTQYDVEALAKAPPNKIEPLFQEIVTTKGTSKKPKGTKGGYRWKDRPRGKMEIEKTIGILMKWGKLSGLSSEEMGYVTSALSWVMKGIESKEFLESRLGFPGDCVIVDENDKVIGLKDSDGEIMKF